MPLEPQHGYRVEATPHDSVGGRTEDALFVSSFVTSDALLEPLTLSGELRLSLRGDQVDIVECGPCGYDCKATGKRRALMADVQLPAPSAGQGVYRGVLHFSDHSPVRVSARDPAAYEEVLDGEPHEVQLTQFVKMDAGEALTLHEEVVEEGFAYSGCFTCLSWGGPGGAPGPRPPPPPRPRLSVRGGGPRARPPPPPPTERANPWAGGGGGGGGASPRPGRALGGRAERQPPPPLPPPSSSRWRSSAPRAGG